MLYYLILFWDITRSRRKNYWLLFMDCHTAVGVKDHTGYKYCHYPKCG